MKSLDKHSLVINNKHTSISLEETFWLALKAEAQAQGVTPSQLVSTIADARTSGSLSGAVRTYLFQRRQGEGDAAHG